MKCFRGGRRTSAWQTVTQLSHTSIRKPDCKWFAWILHPLGTRAAWEINHTRISTTPVLKHWTWKAVEFSCSVFYICLCTNAGLPMRVKESCLCTMKILFQTKLNYFYLGFWRLFFQALQVVLFCWILVFCFVLLFFNLNIPFFVLCTPGRSRRGTVMVWQKYWPKQEVPETSRETFLRSEVQVCHFETRVCPE